MTEVRTFIGAPCRRCGNTKRYIRKKKCVECHRARTNESRDRRRRQETDGPSDLDLRTTVELLIDAYDESGFSAELDELIEELRGMVV